MSSFEDIFADESPTAEQYNATVAMSERFQEAMKAPDWNNKPEFNMADAAKASYNPIKWNVSPEDLLNLKSDTGTIAWNTFRKFVVDLQSKPDRASIGVGNLLAGVSGDTIGSQIRDVSADYLMKTMEDSRFIDANYGDPETWTADWVGGGLSMLETVAVGAAYGPFGLGAYMAMTDLGQGALNDMVKYQEEHGSLEGYKTDPVNLAIDTLNATYDVASELVFSPAGKIARGKFLKPGKTSTNMAREFLENWFQESTQGLSADVAEVLKGNQDVGILLDNASGYMKDGVVAGVLGAGMKGAGYKFNKNRALTNLDKINAALHPEMNEKQVREISEDVFEKTEQKVLDTFVPEIVAHAEAVNDKGKIRENVRTKIASMYEDADMSEQEKAQTIEATTSLELENMLYDSIERKIPLTANPLLQGEVNELGWFRNGIPEQRRQEIENLRKEYVNLRDELKAQNESAEKDYNKIDELETKLEVFRTELPNKLQDLIVADREQIRKMLAEQRESVADSQAKKRMISAIKRKAQSAIKAQEKADTKLAEQMARGAEKAQLQREKKETAQQTKEAKIRDLQEQREIARAIKGIKLKTKETKTTQNRQLNRAIEQATDESLRGVLLKNQWQEPLVKRLTSRQLRTEVKNLPNVSINDLVPMSVREATTRQEQIESKVAGKEKTVKGYFHRKINRQFAKDSGILYAWGYSNEDPAINLVFLKDGGIDDWGEIAESLSNGGYLPDIQDSYELEDARIEQAKDIVLNRADMDLNNLDDTVSKQIDYTEDVGYDMLKKAGLSDADIQDMSYQQMSDKLTELYREQQPQITEPEINLDAIPDDIMPQESFDLADENARLDDIYPEYTGETIEVDGKERTVYNSNGDRIAKSKEALTNFWRWFGDSKVVDEQGRPLVVYHGGKKGIKSFSNRYAAEKNMFFFTSNLGVAEDYRGYNNENIEDTMVYNVYLKINNPLVLRNESDLEIFSKIMHPDNETLRKEWLDRQQVKLKEWVKDFDISYWFGQETIRNRDKIKEFAVKNGYDGIFNYEPDTRGGFSKNSLGFIVFKPNQIKSVDNRGTYSADTGNIYYQTTEDLFDDIMTGSVDDKDGEHRVHINPTPRTLQGILNLEGSQRLLISKKTGNWYFANSLNSIHKDMLQTLIDNGYETGNREDVFNSDLFDTYMIDNGSEQKYEGNYFIYGTKANISWFMGNPWEIDKIKKNYDDIIAKYPNMENYLGRFDEKKNVTLLAKRLDDEIKRQESMIEHLHADTERRDYLVEQKKTLMDKYGITQDEVDNFYNNQSNAAFDSLSKLREFYKQTQMQPKTTGGKDTYRGAYLPEYRFIAKTANMDASTLNHELAHDWGQEYFRWARSGKASESFLRSWGAVEKAIGITDNDTYFTYDASEKFARAYEGWLLQKKDWAKILKIDNDDDKKAVESMMEDYRKQLVDIYESLVESSKYFKETFGEVGELKPELVDFFERATRYDDIELREKRGEITAEQANQEKLNHLVETAVNGQVENMPVEQAQEADAIGQIQDLQETANDTERFETEGGNVKSLQRRLDRIALAQDLTQNDKDLGKYDSHRDMLAVAEQADEFVKNRRDDALAIINGEMAEQDGLYASDLYTALERVANSTGDFDLIQELRNSKIANEMAKELGQRIAGFRNYKGSGDVDVISVLNSLDKQLKTEYNKNKSTADEYIGGLVAELKSVDNNAQLDAFFDEMECR